MKEKEKFRVALLDFDGTLVTKDILDLLCQEMGKGEESQKLNEAFHRGEMQGMETLIARINFLRGMSTEKIQEILQRNAFLMTGVKELMSFFKQNHIQTILASGNILPVLAFYQNLLGIDYIIGATPQMNGNVIDGIDQSAFSSKSFKVDGIKKKKEKLNVKKEEILAIGDSPADKGLFSLASFTIAINPKGDIGEFADVVIHDDLQEVIKFL